MRSSLFILALVLFATPSVGKAAEFYNEDLGDGAQAIIITGEIERGDDEKFRQLTIRFPDAIVVLDSPGGALAPALELGRLIRLRGYTTVVLDEDTCTSSCALMWLAGGRRLKAGSGRVGFHASYIDETGKKVESGVANAVVGHYLSQLGLSQRAVVFATMASPHEIAWLTTGNNADAGIEFAHFPSEDGASRRDDVAPAPPAIQTYAVSQTTAEVLRAEFRAPGLAESGARAIGASGALVGPLTEHLRLIFENDSVIDLVAQEIDAAKIDIRKNPQAGGALMFRLSTGLMTKGMKRLPQRDVNQFISYMSAVALTDDVNCSTFEDTGAANTREAEAIARLGDNHLQSYLRLMRKAMFAEAENFPAPITIDARQMEIAENAWAEVLAEAVAERGGSEELLATLENYNEAEPQQQCDAKKLMLPAIAGMKGMAGDWFRRVYLDYALDSY